MSPKERVASAWAIAYDEIGKLYPTDGEALFPQLQQWAPGIASRIETAEREAEQVSVRWMEGGPGGVQTAINLWRDVWLEAIAAVRHG